MMKSCNCKACKAIDDTITARENLATRNEIETLQRISVELLGALKGLIDFLGWLVDRELLDGKWLSDPVVKRAKAAVSNDTR